MKGYVTIEDGCVEGARDKRPLVSVIVPVYNVERYLDQALASIEGQTLRNIEVLCVNDGSTDESLAIMRNHAAQDDRIRVIDKPNGGYGSACNRGLDEARGTWVAVLEPDDWIEPGMYADMVAFAGRFARVPDIVKTPYWRVVFPDTPDERSVNCSYRGRIKPAAQPFVITDAGAVQLLRHHPSIWSAIYRRDFIERCRIRFREIPGAGWADNPFLVETLCQAEAIAYLDEPYYRYREETPEQADEATRRAPFLPFDRWHDMMDVLERLGMDDPGVMGMQYDRAFIYLNQAATAVDLESPEMQEQMGRMFARMDDERVLGHPDIPPDWKVRYAQMKGLPEPKVDRLAYAASLARAGLYNLKNVGPLVTLKTTANYFRQKSSR